MTSIRTLVSGEETEFLRLLCEVFELDYMRAAGVFTREPFFDLDRKWALFESGHMVAVLTTVPLTFGWGRAVGIAGVATHLGHRGRGHARTLLRHVLENGAGQGEAAAYLFARRTELYEEIGFRTLDEVVRAPFLGSGGPVEPLEVPFQEVQRRYEWWVEKSENRLRRDDKRWHFWNWNLRLAEEFGDGYLVNEAGIVREVIPGEGFWPVGPTDEWLGLRSMSELIGAPLGAQKTEAFLMAHGTSAVPQMFLTDQF